MLSKFGRCVTATFLVGFVWFMGCGGDSGVGGQSDESGPGSDTGAPKADLPSWDVTFPDIPVDYGKKDECQNCPDGDAGTLDVPEGNTDGGDAGPALEPCVNGDSCPTGFCIELEDGSKVCAPPCLDQECPAGWECRPVSGVGGDVTFICLPTVARLCKPCQYHEDCRPSGVETQDLCVDWGPDGKFCGRDCSLGGTCPVGYSCFEVSDPLDRSVLFEQCLPTEGECICTDYYIENGFKTDCFLINDQGTCWGERYCAPEGLTACDALVPEAEVCDGQDQNCDGTTDEGIPIGSCEKTFGELVCSGAEVCEGGELVCNAQEPGPETCDGIDNDCNGETDPEDSEGCWPLFKDGDGDTYGTVDVKCLCGPDGPWAAQSSGDCDDGDVWVNPSVTEACNGKDDDCDGQTDEDGAVGCTDRFLDVDGDGFGTAAESKCLCGDEEGWVQTAGDCEDGNPEIHPGAQEMCDAVDNDCNGVTDGEGAEDCEDFHYDGDADGWGADSDKKCLCTAVEKYSAKQAGDCEDANPAVNPGVGEMCDGIDNDCDGTVDEEGAQGCSVFYADQDSDSWGKTVDSKCLCAAGFPYLVNQAGDCDDADPFAYPGGEEKCNGKDDDCDGAVDEIDAVGCQVYYFDNDSDGWGIPGNTQCLCAPSGAYSGTQTEDCNDYDAGVHPGAPEACDNKDNDCNSHIDEGEGGADCLVYYHDGDADGWGLSSSSKCLCKITGKYSTQQAGDCNDGNGAVNPAALEVCNGQDDDCNLQIDEGEGIGGCSIFYYDGDSDGWGVGSDSRCYCNPTGYYKASNPGDCDDAHNTAHPGGNEVCDLLDNDCNGTMDDPFIPETYNSYSQSGVLIGSMNQDLPNAFYGPMISTCIWDGSTQFCTGLSSVQSGRLLPAGDQDWLSVFKGDSWGAVFGGKVVFSGPPGRSYRICACYSTFDTQCGLSSNVCAVSTNGSQVTVQTSTGSTVTQGWLDFSVQPVGGNDYDCGLYNLTWSVW